MTCICRRHGWFNHWWRDKLRSKLLSKLESTDDVDNDVDVDDVDVDNVVDVDDDDVDVDSRALTFAECSVEEKPVDCMPNVRKRVSRTRLDF